VERIPMPAGLVSSKAPPRALVFDSSYDQYRGVVAFVRVVDGSFAAREPLRAMAQGTRFEAEEAGFFAPTMKAADTLGAGEVGYVITGLKDVSRLRVGDTLTSERRPAGMPRELDAAEEPYIRASIIVPKGYVGPVMELNNERRGRFDHMEYLSPERVLLAYELPLAEIVLDYYDQLKSRTRGYASFDY